MTAELRASPPVIGLSIELLEPPTYPGRRRFQLFTDYLDCLRAAGAVPVLLPADAPPAEVSVWFERIDGLLLTGGDDVDLRPLGGPAPTDDCKPIPAVTQELELALVRGAFDRELPVLGVCLGMQMMGLACRAPYVQHMDQHAGHTGGVQHEVRCQPGSLLARVVGSERFRVPSFHHQALAAAGEGLRAVAWSEDGTLEAVEHPGLPFALGVQWHPERDPDSPAARALFSGFVEAARSYRRSRSGRDRVRS